MFHRLIKLVALSLGAAILFANPGTARADPIVPITASTDRLIDELLGDDVHQVHRRRCHWERRRVRRRECWRNRYGNRRCRIVRRWKRVRVCRHRPHRRCRWEIRRYRERQCWRNRYGERRCRIVRKRRRVRVCR